VVGNWDTGTVQKVVSDALAVYGKFDAIICQHGCRGVTNALAAAGITGIPVGGDAENGFVKALAINKIPGISGPRPARDRSRSGRRSRCSRARNCPLVNLPTPNVETKDMKANVNYFPDEPDTFETVTGYSVCGADMVFPPAELNAQNADNN